MRSLFSDLGNAKALCLGRQHEVEGWCGNRHRRGRGCGGGKRSDRDGFLDRTADGRSAGGEAVRHRLQNGGLASGGRGRRLDRVKCNRFH